MNNCNPFIVQYMLPNGVIAGYHVSGGGAISASTSGATRFGAKHPSSPEEQVRLTREILKENWKNLAFKRNPIWGGVERSEEIEIAFVEVRGNNS